ncbi:ABC transporter ATPase [Polaribacter reichenbachii]|uniref:ABC transporter ATPase n=1 Tax=Polaribacter reichenbachii TaxID=996801 RepID=A0A1B8U3J1_9FLAO|nr:ABC transporter ATPase [Polaribacter reichenbachii]APZ46591.1 ABC transporter ATPase [Polaribacter reichenbachii]AUC17237.1 ABC transporter ATPase [Polaribacter reichenbachii]OBY66415.1 ABC transporter ATPase [Polaribacter reichenbachii]
MFTEYKNLPNNSRVWIYQSDREFTNKEVEFISTKTEEFINAWTRHGDDLKGSFTIKYNQFLVLAVDESFNNVSGCSIDSSVRFVQELEKELELDLMNKMNITFKDNEHINLVKLSDFQRFAAAKKITSETIVFNNMVDTKEDFENNWEVPAKQSWHKRFLV